MKFLKAIFFLVFILGVFAAYGDDAADVRALSDEFNDKKTLSNWKLFSETEQWPSRIEKLDVNRTRPGHLYLEPTYGGWWNGFHGAFLYKEIQGDFVLTVKLMVTGKNTPLPTVGWNRGGLLVRKPGNLALEPKDRKENILHIMTGVNGNKDFVVYTGDSRENAYRWKDKADASRKESTYVELGVFRIGEVFITFYRYGENEWRILRKVSRNDLAAGVLQIGLTACAEPYGKDGVWLNNRYSEYEYNRQVLPSALPADVKMAVDYFRVAKVVLGDADRALILENKLDDEQLLEEIKKRM